MVSAKKLIKLARKWQKFVVMRRKGITLPESISNVDTSSPRSSSTAEKGHFVVYSADQKRFLLPLEYLNNEIVREMLNLAEEEFGLPGNGLLTLPCDAELMEYVITLMKCRVTRDVEKALLMSIVASRCFSSADLHYQVTSYQSPICSF